MQLARSLVNLHLPRWCEIGGRLDSSHASQARHAIKGVPWLLPFGIALLLIVLNASLAFVALNYFHSTNARADHSLHTMVVLQRIEDLVETSDTGYRNYRLFGDGQSLEAYRTARRELPAALAQLRDLTREDVGQADRLATLTRMIEQDSAAMAADLSPVEARFSDGRLPPSVAADLTRRDAITAALDTMLKAERQIASDELATADTEGTRALGGGSCCAPS